MKVQDLSSRDYGEKTLQESIHEKLFIIPVKAEDC